MLAITPIEWAIAQGIQKILTLVQVDRHKKTSWLSSYPNHSLRTAFIIVASPNSASLHQCEANI